MNFPECSKIYIRCDKKLRQYALWTILENMLLFMITKQYLFCQQKIYFNLINLTKTYAPDQTAAKSYQADVWTRAFQIIAAGSNVLVTVIFPRSFSAALAVKPSFGTKECKPAPHCAVKPFHMRNREPHCNFPPHVFSRSLLRTLFH